MAEEEEIDTDTADEMEDIMEELKIGDKSYGYPKPPSKESIFKFFRHILDLEDSSKVGNLDKAELGMPNIPVRAWQEIANYAEAENLDIVTAYLRSKGEVTLSTSMAKKGFLAQLFVTQIKKEQKLHKPKEKKGLFSKSSEDET